MKLIHFIIKTEGAGLAEYAILLLLIALVCVTILLTLGGAISDMFININGKFG